MNDQDHNTAIEIDPPDPLIIGTTFELIYGMVI